jgi:hypothetical protein
LSLVMVQLMVPLMVLFVIKCAKLRLEVHEDLIELIESVDCNHIVLVDHDVL